MSYYRTMKIQILESGVWTDCSWIDPSNRPHSYDDIFRPAFELFVKAMKIGLSGNTSESPSVVGCRIVYNDSSVIDVWTSENLKLTGAKK